jgi:hypothetical protein
MPGTLGIKGPRRHPIHVVGLSEGNGAANDYNHTRGLHFIRIQEVDASWRAGVERSANSSAPAGWLSANGLAPSGQTKRSDGWQISGVPGESFPSSSFETAELIGSFRGGLQLHSGRRPPNLFPGVPPICVSSRPLATSRIFSD